MALDSYTIRFFAWCKTDKNDKVWGYVEFKNAPELTEAQKRYPRWNPPEPGSLYNFWGRRGKTYSFKRHYGHWGLDDLKNLAHKKLYPSGDKAPYVEVSVAEIEKICPGFAEEFENQLLMAKFGGGVRNDDTEGDHSFI